MRQYPIFERKNKKKYMKEKEKLEMPRFSAKKIFLKQSPEHSLGNISIELSGSSKHRAHGNRRGNIPPICQKQKKKNGKKK